MNSSLIEMYHTGLWTCSQDIDCMDIDEYAKIGCRDLINISIKKFDKFWRNKKFNFKMNFIKNNIKQATNLGIFDGNYFIVVDQCYINKNTELFGTFYLTIEKNLFEQSNLFELFPLE